MLRRASKSHSSRRPRHLIRLAIVFLLAGTAYSWYTYNQSPAVGTVATISPVSQDVKAAETEIQYATFNGQTVSFTYPALYDKTQLNQAQGPFVEQFTLNANVGALETRKLAVTVRQNTNEINEDSAYVFRMNSPDLYTASVETINGTAVTIVKKNDESEVAYFIPGSRYYAMIVASSTRPGGAFLEDGQKVIESFSWND